MSSRGDPSRDLPDGASFDQRRRDELRVRRWLARAERPTMPSAVAERIENAIRSQAQLRRATTDMSGRSASSSESGHRMPHQRAGRSGSPRLLRTMMPAAASVAAIAMVGAAVIPAMSSPEETNAAEAAPDCSVTARVPADLTAVGVSSGSQYGAHGLVQQAIDVMPHSCDHPVQPIDSGQPLDSGQSRNHQQVPDRDEGVGGTVPHSSTGSERMDSHWGDCVMAWVGSRPVMSIDVARYGGIPAAVVMAHDPDQVAVLDCSRHPPRVLGSKLMPSHP